jgi:hypothetical protein
MYGQRAGFTFRYLRSTNVDNPGTQASEGNGFGMLVKYLATLSYNSLTALIDLQSLLLSGVLRPNDAQVAPTCLKSAFLPTAPPFLLRLLNTATGI